MTLTTAATNAIAPNKSPAPACLFLDKLPAEIRLKIYGNLLVQELAVKSHTYNINRQAILQGPDHSYDLNPPILSTNRQIRAEALDLFQREIILVSITLHTVHDWYNGAELKECGVALISTQQQARARLAIGLRIDFNAGEDREQRGPFLFMIEDLPAACVYLQRKVDQFRGRDQPSSIRLRVSPLVSGGRLLPNYKANRYLGPLWRVHGVHRVEIHGPVDAAFKAATIASMRGRRLRAKEVMRLVGAQVDKADKASQEGRLWASIDAYKAALLTIRENSLDKDEDKEVVRGGRFDGQLAGRARENTEVRLHSLIAATYLQCNKYRMARVYVERIYGPLHSMDYRCNFRKVPLDIPSDNQVMSGTYAELLHVAAKISLTHGQEDEAIAELREACELDPWDASIKELLEQVSARRDARAERRHLEQNHQEWCATEKYDEAFLVARNRKIKGDKAFQVQDWTRASKYYEAAYEKTRGMESVSIYRGPPTELALDALIKLIAVYLKLDDYDNVRRCSDATLEIKSWSW